MACPMETNKRDPGSDVKDQLDNIGSTECIKSTQYCGKEQLIQLIIESMASNWTNLGPENRDKKIKYRKNKIFTKIQGKIYAKKDHQYQLEIIIDYHYFTLNKIVFNIIFIIS